MHIGFWTIVPGSPCVMGSAQHYSMEFQKPSGFGMSASACALCLPTIKLQVVQVEVRTWKQEVNPGMNIVLLEMSIEDSMKLESPDKGMEYKCYVVGALHYQLLWHWGVRGVQTLASVPVLCLPIIEV